jgi:Ca2+-binding RTX toxin-like protein
VASDSNDYIIYNPNTGALSYDNDGSAKNAAMQIALIGAHLSLSNADFVVI